MIIEVIMLKLYSSIKRKLYIFSKANAPITPLKKVNITTLNSKDFTNLLTTNVSGKNEIGYKINVKDAAMNK